MTQFQFQLSIGSVGHSGLFLFDPLVEAVTGIQYSLSGKGERRTSTLPVENNQPGPAWPGLLVSDNYIPANSPPADSLKSWESILPSINQIKKSAKN